MLQWRRANSAGCGKQVAFLSLLCKLHFDFLESPPAERTEEEAARRSRGYIVMARHPSVIRDVLELLKSFRLDLSGSFGLLAEQTTNLNESILDVFDNYELFDSYDLLPAQEHKGTWVSKLQQKLNQGLTEIF